MNVFLFQSVPDRYDLRQHLEPGARDTWYATRYRTEMKPGDIVLFWMSGDEHFRGLYGWGRLTSAPYLKPTWDSHGVDVIYEVKFQQPIKATQLRAERGLAEMLIFRAPQATNFLLTPQEAKRLVHFIAKRGETAPSLPEGEQ